MSSIVMHRSSAEGRNQDTRKCNNIKIANNNTVHKTITS